MDFNKVTQEVCKYMNITPTELFESRLRHSKAQRARHILIYLCKKLTYCSDKELSDKLGFSRATIKRYSQEPLYLEGSLQAFIGSILKQEVKPQATLTITATLFDRGLVSVDVSGSLPLEHIPELKEKVNVLLDECVN